MIPTIPFELLFAGLAGLAFAACARIQFRRGASPWGRELLAVLSYEAIVVWPVILYFCLAHPAWSWMYFIDPETLPRGTTVLVLVANLLFLLVGYFLGWALLRARKDRTLWVLAGLLFVAMSTLLLIFRHRVGQGADYLGFLQGRASPLGQTKLGWALVPTSLGMLAAGVMVGVALVEQGRRSRE